MPAEVGFFHQRDLQPAQRRVPRRRQAVDAAAYTGFTDPLNIRLIRGEESVEIKVKDLLRGTKNPVLEAEDIIEIRR
ncbi:MAG: hypothetical protein NTW03_19215 [Verrucomicrobia bacterium]|nr:hypothetical protein [Verrucomicrobiota bacterium]